MNAPFSKRDLRPTSKEVVSSGPAKRVPGSRLAGDPGKAESAGRSAANGRELRVRAHDEALKPVAAEAKTLMLSLTS